MKSPKEIAKIANEFFIAKINDIRKKFTPSTCDPIKILDTLIPRNKNTFKLPLITVTDTKKIIKKLKNSNSTGHDSISNRVIKKLKDKIAPHITHMINTIILESKFPDIFKLTRILPFSKPNKKLDNIENYRPINNLPALEKIFEEWVKINLEDFLNENKIIHKNHHGGRKKFSTLTAKTQIDHQLLKNYENDKISVVLTTDLSAAYDTIDHKIFLLKLDHYGIRGAPLKLIESYLKDRKQFVEIEIFRSEILDSLECSVIQGSKLSGLFYTLYTNEIPLLYKLLHNEWYEKLTGTVSQKFKSIYHLTVNFVDDSTSIITFSETNQIRKYLENYYNLLQNFYNINKLKINPDKTCLLTSWS